MQAPPTNRRKAITASTPPVESPASSRDRNTSRPRAPKLPAVPLRDRPWFKTARRIGSWLTMLVVLAGSVIGGRAAHRWITHTPRFGAKDIEVVGLVHTRRDEVLTAAHIAPGTNVLGLDTRAAERAIAQLPWVERAKVTRKLPSSIRIEIEERVAAAIVNAGGLYLAATDGAIFKRLQPGDPDDLPVVTGIQRQDFEHDEEFARESVRDALALLADVAASSLNNRIHVEEVHRDPTGDLSLVMAGSGTYVWFGRGPYRAKMSRLSTILDELNRQHIVAAEIHLESDRHPERATIRVPVSPPPAVVASPASATPSGPQSIATKPQQHAQAHAPASRQLEARRSLHAH